MAYTTINKPNTYFNTVLYTGNNSTNNITGVNFKPDFTWIKDRSTTGESNYLMNITTGNNQFLLSNSTASERTGSISNGYNSIAFASDGFDITNSSGLNDETNLTGRNYVAWNWLASNTTAANTDGSLSSTVSVNTTSGFSIVKYTGDGSGSSTVGHGLGTTPDVIILKNRNQATNWDLWIKTFGAGEGIILNLTAAKATDASKFPTLPTSSYFYPGTNSGTNGSGNSHIAYCFAEKKGFSKFGSYTGNGSSDGTFVYTGFKPAFVLIKNYGAAGDSWQLQDNKRLGYNVDNNVLSPNTNGAESTADVIDMLSNGFKIRTTASGWNSSGVGYIYMAFAENPLVTTSGVPATAR